MPSLKEVLEHTYVRIVPAGQAPNFGRMDDESVEGVIYVLRFHGFLVNELLQQDVPHE